mgnify:CR=1 FL=1|tara:strand:- start:331 stop:765 length:435 start_codon:yes stop_codon:yes gene_type:complete
MKLKVALIVLYDSEKKFLLQHRSEDAERLPCYWGFFGGGIRKAESPEDAVRRETFEELNHKLKFPELVVKQNFELENFNGFMYVYIEEFNGIKSKLRLQEGQGWGWFKEYEIDKLKMTNNDRGVVKYIARYLDDMTSSHTIIKK